MAPNKKSIVLTLTFCVLLVMTLHRYFKPGAIDQPLETELEKFATSLKPEEKAQFLELFGKFHEFAVKNEILYFLTAGTLMGYCRHEGFIPWDDDFDTLIFDSDKDKLYTKLSEDDYMDIHKAHPHMWKVFKRSSKSIDAEHKEGWPFIDVFFIKRVGDEIHLTDPYRKFTKFQSSDIFPLRSIKFENQMTFAPNKPHTVIKFYVGDNYMDSCRSLHRIHRIEKEIKKSDRLTVPCSRLHPHFPFRFMEKSSSGYLITVKIGNNVISTYTNDDDVCSL